MRFLLVFCLMAATPAFAQQAPDPQGPPGEESRRGPGQPQATIIAEPVGLMIAAFDADGDARVTRTEFDAGVARSFASADPTGSGSIGYLAYADWALRWLGDRNALPGPFEVDRNDDNRITLEELNVRFALLFTRFDKDQDGVIVRAELLTVRNPPRAPESRDRRREEPPTENRRPRS